MAFGLGPTGVSIKITDFGDWCPVYGVTTENGDCFTYSKKKKLSSLFKSIRSRG